MHSMYYCTIHVIGFSFFFVIVDVIVYLLSALSHLSGLCFVIIRFILLYCMLTHCKNFHVKAIYTSYIL